MEKRNSRTHKWRKRIPLMFLSLLCDPQMILSKCDPIFLFHTHSHQRKERCKLHNVDLHLAQTGIPTAGNRKTVHRPIQSATASRGQNVALWLPGVGFCSLAHAPQQHVCQESTWNKGFQDTTGKEKPCMHHIHIYFRSFTKPSPLTEI